MSLTRSHKQSFPAPQPLESRITIKLGCLLSTLCCFTVKDDNVDSTSPMKEGSSSGNERETKRICVRSEEDDEQASVLVSGAASTTSSENILDTPQSSGEEPSKGEGTDVSSSSEVGTQDSISSLPPPPLVSTSSTVNEPPQQLPTSSAAPPAFVPLSTEAPSTPTQEDK